MKITFLDINDLKSRRILDEWLKDLPNIVIEDILRYKQDKDQWRVLGGKLLLSNALSEAETSILLDELSFTENGKPYFKHSNFKFNISHSGDFVILIVADQQECGIDIELHRPIDWNAFRRNFTIKEWDIILNAEDSRIQFFNYWAIKESVIKADGRGVAVLGKTEILSESHAICDGKQWFIRPFSLVDGYSSCLALDKEISEISLVQF